MASELSIRIARQLIGTVVGNWKCQEVRIDRGVVKVICQCTNSACQHSRLLTLNEIQMEQRQAGCIRCPGWERHAIAPKELKKPQLLTLDMINRMPADEYRRRLEHEPGFRERAESILASAPKAIDRQQAIEQKEAHDREAKLAPARAMFENAWYAYDSNNLKAPFHRLEGWLALDEETRQNIIKRFDLNNTDWTPSLAKLLGG
jgi:hypothetical protein